MRHEVESLTGYDGEQVYYREWQGNPDKDVLVYLHGIESHTGWFIDTGNKLSESGFNVFALERRGSGINKKDRGYIRTYQIFIDDVKLMLEHIKKQYPDKKIYLIGLCWGGKLAVICSTVLSNLIDGLILISPAIKTKVTLPFRQKLDVAFSNFFRPYKLFDIPIHDYMFTKNHAYMEFIKNDPFRLTRATARFFFETAKMQIYINRTAHELIVPVLVFLAGDDAIVDNASVKKWFENIGSKDKQMKIFQGSCHSIEFEEESKDLISEIRRWVDERKD